jgi:hypothetical protein
VVDIRGSGFLHATGVLFGGAPASSYTVVSGAEIRATVPAAAASGKITVRTAGGSAKSGASFTVTGPAHVVFDRR